MKADGVAKKGKTSGKQLGIDGPTQALQNGGKGSGGVTGAALKAVGRNMARANNQKGK